MNPKLYTNTGKVGSIVGLVVTALALSYVTQHSTEIVNGTFAMGKKLVKAGKQTIDNHMTEEVEVWSTLPNGEKYNTGMKVRRNTLVHWLKTH